MRISGQFWPSIERVRTFSDKGEYRVATSIFPGEKPDRLEEECAVFGVYSTTDDVARLTCFGLQALQHRGQESAGIAVGDGDTVTVTKDLGLVTQVFNESALAALRGEVAVGHCRYSTSGGMGNWTSAQPHMSAIDEVLIALAHNGTLVNTNRIRADLISKGVEFRSNTDSEVACQVIGYYTRETHHLTEGIKTAMEMIDGAYAMVLASPTALYAFRDPHGIRPLCLGKLPDDRGWVVSSETCGLDIVGAEFVRDVRPGEIIRINDTGISTLQAIEPREPRGCIFEYVYFARPDSVIDGQSVYQARRNMGRILAREAPVEADLVLGVPDSGVPGALGYSEASGIEFTDGIVKNRYVGRTFIQPTQEMRQMGIRIKLNPLPSVIAGKRLVVIGGGGEMDKLKAMAGPTIEFKGGGLTDEEVRGYYLRAKAFLFPGEEDFGITPVEAQSAGTPVLAYGRGGACETVLPGKTGYWFEEQTADSLAACIQRFEKDGVAYSKEEIREHSRAFSEERFEREIKEYCTRRMADWQQELLDCSHWEKEEQI